MSLLDKASLILTPNAYKESKLYSVIPSNGNGDMTVVRGTTATRVNSSGLIESVGVNVPRLNYDTVGGCPSILLEPQRTNLALYSEEFDNATFWVKTNSSIVANSTISPNNSLNADSFIPDTTNGDHRVNSSSFVPAINTYYTISVYAKSNGYNFIRLSFGGSGGGGSTFFDLSNGTIGSTVDMFLNSITNAGNGWYRCSVTRQLTTTNNTTVDFYCTSANNQFSWIANGTSGISIWGAQLEQGAYPTSYIPTTTTALTRNGDIIIRDNIYTNGLITSLGGTWFVELDNNFALVRDVASSFSLQNSSLSESNAFVIKTAGGALFRLVINKRIADVESNLYLTSTNKIKVAIKWNGVTADVFVNGIKVVSAAIFTTTIMQYMNLSAADVPKYIKSTMLFPTPLTDTECASLTTL